MISEKLLVFISMLAVMSLLGCRNGDQNKETISTDLVTNPNSASGTVNRGSLPVIKFEDLEHDFGRIIEGETVSYAFNFKNSGKSDLIIADVTTSCGCTVPSYPKAPLRPGEAGTIKVSFNSRGKRGYQTKNILVVANTQPNTTMIRIKALVVNPATEK